MGNIMKIDKKWIGGIPYEIAFWNNVYRWNITFKGMMGWSHFGSVIYLEGFDAGTFLKNKTKPIVLDIGCGMSYATGNMIETSDKTTPLDIHYIDPLAPYFNKILKRQKRNLPKIEFGVMEYLSIFYPDHNIDLAIIQNALDHSSNPVKGIYEAIDILKKGGVLYLNHHPNEAETENYKGFHQYNIINEDNKLIIWNRNEKWNVNKLIKDFAEIKVHRCENGNIIAVIIKTAPVPVNLVSDLKKTRKDAIDSLFDRIINRPKKSFIFKIKYIFFNTIQFFIQALSWETKMKLKRIIRQA